MNASKAWYMQTGVRVPDNVTPGKPRRHVAQEFFTNVLELGRHARAQYLDECQRGLQVFNQKDIDELDANIAIVEAELSKVK